MFEWMEFIVHNNPIASAGIKKLSETPVTSFKYFSIDDPSEGSIVESDSWRSVLEDSLNMKSKLLSISYNTLLYGNCFVSVYSPIVRFLKCDICKEEIQIKHAKRLKVFIRSKAKSGFGEHEEYQVDNNFNPDDVTKNSKDVTDKYKKINTQTTPVHFVCGCSSCKKVTPHSVRDMRIKSKEDINIITWDPNSIKLVGNQISGQTEFYYEVPVDMIESVKNNDKFLLATMPIGMIEAALTKKLFRFSDGHIFHSRRETIAGVSSSWGMPALASAIPPFLTLMILRKANEKIATDYMVPLRTVFPTQQSGPGELYNFMGGSDFVSKINGMLNKWKMDPSAVQTTPFPIGTETILGDGKLLSLNQEIDQLESNIANSLGIPIEFIKGGLSYTSQGSSLRLLENQLARLSANLDDVMAFVIDRVALTLDKEPIKVQLLPFKIVDDLQEKAAIVQLAASGQGMISTGTMLELFNMDSNAEQKRILGEQKSGVKNQVDLQGYQQEVITSIEETAKNKAQMNTSNFQTLNQQSLMAEAQQYVDQLMQMDDGARKSQLDEMSKVNYIMYGVVKALLEMNRGKESYQATQQINGQQDQEQGQPQ